MSLAEATLASILCLCCSDVAVRMLVTSPITADCFFQTAWFLWMMHRESIQRYLNPRDTVLLMASLNVFGSSVTICSWKKLSNVSLLRRADSGRLGPQQ